MTLLSIIANCCPMQFLGPNEKREINTCGYLTLVIRALPTLWSKTFRVGPMLWMTSHYIWTTANRGTFWDYILIKFNIVGCYSYDTWCRWVQSQRFFQTIIQVFEFRQIIVSDVILRSQNAFDFLHRIREDVIIMQQFEQAKR